MVPCTQALLKSSRGPYHRSLTGGLAPFHPVAARSDLHPSDSQVQGQDVPPSPISKVSHAAERRYHRNRPFVVLQHWRSRAQLSTVRREREHAGQELMLVRMSPVHPDERHLVSVPGLAVHAV